MVEGRAPRHQPTLVCYLACDIEQHGSSLGTSFFTSENAGKGVEEDKVDSLSPLGI